MRAEVVKSFSEEMINLENEVVKKDTEMKQISGNVSREIENAIDLPGLSHKLFTKYMNYIQSQVNITIKEKPPYTRISLLKRGLVSPQPGAESNNQLAKAAAALDTSADMINELKETTD